MSETIIVVGGGQAAQSVVETLRSDGFAGRVLLIGEEPTPPYQRPPLSKKYLLGEIAADRLFLRPERYFAENDIETRWGARVAAIDPTAKTVALDGGETIGFDRLALTTGARPRRLPAAIGGDLPGVYTLRDLADVGAIAPHVTEGASVAIVGGGYIGLEAAAVCAAKGLRTTVIEMAPRVLARVASPETADYFTRLHASHGVDLRTGAALERLSPRADGATGLDAHLAGGDVLTVDFALVGVGVAPNVALAEAAGLTIDNGIAVDAACRTSNPNIVAAGDCASFPFRGARIRLESVQNAIDQGAAAARTMMGSDAPYEPTPWFWSDQYDVKLQIAGLSTGYDRIIHRPGRTDDAQSIWYFEGDVFRAVDAMNEPRAFMLGRRWLEAGASPDPTRLADPETPLKEAVV